MLKPYERKRGINLQLVFLVVLCVLSAHVYAGQELRSERVVIVQPGETLSEIVEREMRSIVYWPAVARHNNIQDASSITAGQAIRIPLTYTRSNEHAVVLFVKGNVERIATGRDQDSRLRRGDEIRVGDEIRTSGNGFASVEFSAGSIINVQPNSHISVVNLACKETDSNCIIELYVEKGGVQSRVNQRSDQPVKFKIETPSGSAAVRGTVFDVDTSSLQSATVVTRGKVDMSAEGVTAGVDGGFGVVAAAASAPGVPKVLLEPPTMKEAPTRLAKGDMIYWWENTEAESYNVSISKDLEATTVESTANINDSDFAIPVALQGQYYVNIRSIDSQGLKGMPTSLPVQLVSIIKTVKTPIVVGELVGENVAFTLQKGVAADALTYEIQISDNQEFSEAESYDIDVGEGAVVSLPDGTGLWSRARAVFAGFNVSNYSETVRIFR